MRDLTKAPIPQRYKHLLEVISSERFRKMEGLGNEVPFFICPYDPQDAVEMEKMAWQLHNQLANKGIQVLLINLYDLSIEIIKERGIWEKTLEIEKTTPKDQFFEHLESILDPERFIIPAIATKLHDHKYDVLFITGVGEVFPYIRSHTILNNLQSTAKYLPTVMFFPGEYRHSSLDGSSLDLFGLLHDDNYYRAFNIYQYQV
jgi:hypothetical protein